MKKQIENTVVALALILGLISAATASSSLLPVFAQTNQMSDVVAGSNSTKMNEKTNTTQATASASPIKTFSANGDISSLIFVTQKLMQQLIQQVCLMQQNLPFQEIGI